jgi:PAS domain S-box-containing protein
VKLVNEQDGLEREEHLQLVSSAVGLGTWEMDVVNNERHWSVATMAMHGFKREGNTSDAVNLTDDLMLPEDQSRLGLLHDELSAGRDDYSFEYRTRWPNGQIRWIHARGKVIGRNHSGPTRIVGVCFDITRQKQMAVEEHYNEVHFRLLADSLPQLVWITNSKGHVTYYNARRHSYFRDGSANPAQPQWQPLIHPDDLPQTALTWMTAMQDGREYEMEHRLRMADGSFRWHLSRATAVPGQNGRVAAWFGTATDIERLKQAESRIQMGVERLQVATEAASMFAWDINFRTGKMGWADNAADVIGCQFEELDASVAGGNFFVLTEDRERIIAEFNAFWQSGSERFEMQFRGIPRDGKPTYWRTAGKFIRDTRSEPERAVGVTQNITRHIEGAAQMTLLNERLLAAEEGSGALVYDYNVMADVIWRSESLTRILGWGMDEIPTDLQAWRDLMHPDDAARLKMIDLETLMDGGDHYTTEYRIRHKDGRYLWMMDTGRAFRDGNGRIIRQAGTTVDITSRKLSERAQQRLASLIELSFEPILVWHPERGILDWNRGAEILYGFHHADAVGHKPFDLLKTKFPSDIKDLMEHLRKVPSWTGELQNTARNGNVIVVESRFQLIELDGETVVLETNRDIRDSKRADASLARIAAVAAASHDALYGCSLNGMIETWNPGAERLLGFSEAEVLGHHISLLAHPKQHDEQLQCLQRVRTGEIVKPFDTIRRAKDGRLIDVSIAMSPVIAPDGSVTSVSVAVHDISERKEWDERQRLMNRELAHRVKNSFAILQSILRSTLKTSPDPQQFATAFSGRLYSMAAAHDVLTANDWRGAELGALLHHQLSHYVTGQRIRLSGGTVNLVAEHAAPLSLIFNELATNALKYGALSTPQGRIDVAWQIKRGLDHAGTVELQWAERGGPAITAVGSKGFGSTLIERSFAAAEVVMQFPPEGLICTLTWPIGDPAN